MELNQFRDVDVVLDKANDNIIQKQFVSTGDKDGRSLTVQLTDNGAIGEVAGATLNLYWHNEASGLTDLSAFYVVDKATSVFKIDYPQNMLTPGKVTAYIQILHGGKVTHTKPFEITVQKLAGTTRGVLATAEYGALVTTLAKANEFKAEVSAQLQQTEQSLTAQLAQKAEQDALNVEKARIDNLIALPDGSTTNDARLEDITVGYDGNVYDSPGTAVRQQFNDLNLKEVGNNAIRKIVEVEWEIGGITGINGYNDQLTDRIRTKGFITDITIYVDLSNKDNGRWSIIRYNSNGVYVSAEVEGLRVSEYTLSKDYKYRLVYAFNDTISDADQSGSDFVFYNPIKPISIQEKTIQSKHLSDELNNSLYNYPRPSKFVHISADDVIDLFKDLHANVSTYTSIFDNDVLHFLKTLHDQYGLVFSGYCFYQTADEVFNLSQMPNSYAADFTDNSHWLKFGAHFTDINGGNYATVDSATGLESYSNIMTELFRICGSADSLDYVPRLHNYAGSLAFIESISSINLGIKGLLTSEDSRQNYHLDTTMNDFMQKHDRSVDYTHNLKLFSTDIRLDGVTDVKTVLDTRKNDVSYASRMNDIILFTHEQYLNTPAMQTKIQQTCEWATNNDYVFDFPQNHI